jgi:peroxiredoxin
MDQPPPASGRGPLERPLARAAVALVMLTALIGLLVFVRYSRDDGDASGTVIPIDNAPTRTASPLPEEGTGPLGDAPPLVGQPAPDFALRRADGTLVKLSDLKGKVVFVNFWASWCVPCRKELPDIQKVYDEKMAQGLEVLAINYQDDTETATSFFEGRSITLPLLLDHSGKVYDQYRLQGLPDSFFVDREGNIAAFQFGYLTESKMRERLQAAGLE